MEVRHNGTFISVGVEGRIESSRLSTYQPQDARSMPDEKGRKSEKKMGFDENGRQITA